MLRKLSIIGIALAGGAAVAATLDGPDPVRAHLQARGYAQVHDLEFDNGLWEAEAQAADGGHREVVVDPASGEVFDADDGRPVQDAAAVRASLTAAGYTQVRDLDRDGAVWEADAGGPDGARVELRVSGYDGRVLHSEIDGD